MLDLLATLFHLLIFPGGAFAICFGLFLKGFDVKTEASLQRRVGAPFLQPFYDVVKLFHKATVIPHGINARLFLAVPCIACFCITTCAAIIPITGVYAGLTKTNDILILSIFMPLPALLGFYVGSMHGTQRNIFGISKEMKALLGYELPLFTILIVILIASALKVGDAVGGTIELSIATIVHYQVAMGSFITDPAMLPAFFAYLLFLPGYLGAAPFDFHEAETEIIDGPLGEYSGSALAGFHLFALARYAVALSLGVALFFPASFADGTISSFFLFTCKSLLLMLTSITLAKVTCGRLRMDQARKFYFTIPLPLACISLALAWIGY